MQLFVLLVPLVADLLLDFLPLLDEEGGNGSRQAQLRVDLADPRADVHWQQTLQHRANISYLTCSAGHSSTGCSWRRTR